MPKLYQVALLVLREVQLDFLILLKCLFVLFGDDCVSVLLGWRHLVDVLTHAHNWQLVSL